jgi:hypothetical protein
LGAPNATKWIDGIGYVEKNGWDYMHMLRRLVDYPVDEATLNNKPADVDPPITGGVISTGDSYIDSAFGDIDADPDSPTPPPPTSEPTAREALQYTIAAPLAVYIDRVYPYADFSVLGIQL